MEPANFTQLELDLMRLAMESQESGPHDPYHVVWVYQVLREALNAPYREDPSADGGSD